MEDFCLYTGVLRLNDWVKLKKNHKPSISSVHCLTRRQMPLVLKSTFKLRILTPNNYDKLQYNYNKITIKSQ